MKNKPLGYAIAVLCYGIANNSAAEGVVSYNTFNHDRAGPNLMVADGNLGVDGWLRSSAYNADEIVPDACNIAGSSCGRGSSTGNHAWPDNAPVAWVGNDPRTDANFNYAGTQTLNWSVVLNGGESATVSKNDSNNRYGGTVLADGTTFNYADIDSAQGAWHDGIETGFSHDIDIGLFRSEVTQRVKLSASSLLAPGEIDLTPRYGITVFAGQDSSNKPYNHHRSWHQAIDGENIELVGNNDIQISEANPFGSGSILTIEQNGLTYAAEAPASGLDTLILDDVLGNDADFIAEAGKVYTIMLGGFKNGGWTTTRNDYQLNITTSAVPVPSAVWLFGSALLGFVVSRRKERDLG